METSTALAALSALAHPMRLALFRLLVAESEGLPAGEIAARLGQLPSTLSAALAQLERSGLILGHRQGRQIRYAVAPDGIRALLGFLLQDCCGGRPDLCQPAIRSTACAC